MDLAISPVESRPPGDRDMFVLNLVAMLDHHGHLLSLVDINGTARILSDAKADLRVRIPSNTGRTSIPPLCCLDNSCARARLR